MLITFLYIYFLKGLFSILFNLDPFVSRLCLIRTNILTTAEKQYHQYSSCYKILFPFVHKINQIQILFQQDKWSIVTISHKERKSQSPRDTSRVGITPSWLKLDSPQVGLKNPYGLTKLTNMILHKVGANREDNKLSLIGITPRRCKKFSPHVDPNWDKPKFIQIWITQS